MKLQNILLLHKVSNYKLRLAKSIDQSERELNALPYEKKRLITEHEAHYASVDIAVKALKKLGISFRVQSRARKIEYAKFDMVVTLGGDGTFLQAARNVNQQAILGVNSAPNSSIGQFCVVRAEKFERYLMKVLEGAIQTKEIYKIEGRLKKSRLRITAINDFLIAHRNPSALSRYSIEQGRISERHKCSGLWIATAAGSTGAIHSAGGKKQMVTDKNFQYKPRELCAAQKIKYQLRGGILKFNQQLRLISLMRDACIYIDGAHKRERFPYAETLTVRHSKDFIKVFI